MSVDSKYDSLRGILGSLGRVVVAYSGGVDSTFLLRACIEELGADNVLACIAVSESLAGSQYECAIDNAKAMGAELKEVRAHELSDENYSVNKADRCFHCKSHLYGLCLEVAKEAGYEHVVCGSNFEDMDDFRPGNRAAMKMGVRAPLMEAGMIKADIRELSRRFELATADVPASPCLASRISYGLEVTAERLKQVEEAEDFIRSLGFVEFRVRHHDELGRVEVCCEDIERMAEKPIRKQVVDKLKELGFKYVALDMQGFRSGALNEVLSEDEKEKSL